MSEGPQPETPPGEPLPEPPAAEGSGSAPPEGDFASGWDSDESDFAGGESAGAQAAAEASSSAGSSEPVETPGNLESGNPESGEPESGQLDPGKVELADLPSPLPDRQSSGLDAGWVSSPVQPGHLLALLGFLSVAAGILVQVAPADPIVLPSLRVCVAVGVAAAWLYVITWRVWRPRPVNEEAWILPLGVALLLALGQYALQPERSYLPPVDAGDWSVWALLLAGVLGALRAGVRPLSSAWKRLGPIGVCAIGLVLAWLILRAVLHPYGDEHYGSWLPRSDTALFSSIGAAALIGLLTLAIRGLIGHSRLPGEPLPERRAAAFLGAGSLTLLGVCSAGAIGLSGSATLAFQIALVTAALTPWVVLALWRGTVLPRTLCFPLAVAFASAWLTARTYSELPAASAGLLFLGAWAPRLGASRTLRRRQRWLATAFGLGLALLAGGGAVHLAYKSSPPFEAGGAADDPYADYGY